MNPDTRTFHSLREAEEIRSRLSPDKAKVPWLELAVGARFAQWGWWWEISGHDSTRMWLIPVAPLTKRELKLAAKGRI